MTLANPDNDRLTELRQREMLREYVFTSRVPVVGGLIARCRAAWNSVATKWQARPVMEQQSAFNRALVDWLERPAGLAELDDLFAIADRDQTRLNRAASRLALDMANLGGARRGARPQIAYFSPLPPARSGIADYSAELLPHLSEAADITLFVDDPATTNLPGFTVRPASDFSARRADYGLPLYQMGNSDQHDTIYAMLRQYPGIVVLHDYFLHHFIRHRTIGRGDWTGYGVEMGYSLGHEGRRIARAVQQGRADAPLFDAPLNQRAIDAALGLIVHSQFAAERVRRYRPDVPLAVIPALVEPRAGVSLRDKLNLPEDAVLFGSFGQITPAKRIDAALGAFRGVRQACPEAHYLLVGEALSGADPAGLLAAPELRDVTHHIGYVADLAEFINWMHTADVVVNLRQPTAGETSAVALRAMAAGRPLIVYDHGWYSELPDAAALKIPTGDEAALRQAMAALADSAERRRSMGQAGREYVRDFCAPNRVAQAYLAFLQTVVEPARV